MNDYKIPSPEDLNRLMLLNRLLYQSHSHMVNINDEMERFTTQLKKSDELLNDNRLDFEDLHSALLDYEMDLERVKSINLSEQRNSQ